LLGPRAFLCQKASAYAQQCGETNACATAELANCAQTYGAYSDAFVTAIDNCVTAPYTCPNEAGVSPSSACITSAIATLTPSAAQAKLKADFCAKCPDGASKFVASSCSGFYAASDGGTELGALVLYYNDAVATAVDQQCTGSATTSGDSGVNDCAFNFLECALVPVESMSNQPAACADGGGGIGGKAFKGWLQGR
jgi:hypothetical protein